MTFALVGGEKFKLDVLADGRSFLLFFSIRTLVRFLALNGDFAIVSS